MAGNNFPIWIDEIFPFALTLRLRSGLKALSKPVMNLSNEVVGKISGLPRQADNRLMLALDGVQYFSSQKIQGPCCSSKTHSNGKVSYSHTAITPVLVKPGSDKVIPLTPEFIAPQDGREKQDCEINASLRWLKSRGDRYAALGTTSSQSC